MDKDVVNDELRKAYGDLTKPDYGFAQTSYSDLVYSDVIADLARHEAIQDFTDLNSHVAVYLLVGEGEYKIAVWLSMIGRYAILTNLNGRLVEEAGDARVQILLGVIRRHHFEVLEKVDLMEEVRFGGKLVPFLRLLFSVEEDELDIVDGA